MPGEALSLEDFENKANLTTLLDGEYLIVSAREGLGDSALRGRAAERRQLGSGAAGHCARTQQEAGWRGIHCPLTAHLSARRAPPAALQVNKPKDVVRLVTTTEQKVGYSISDGGCPRGTVAGGLAQPEVVRPGSQ